MKEKVQGFQAEADDVLILVASYKSQQLLELVVQKKEKKEQTDNTTWMVDRSIVTGRMRIGRRWALFVVVDSKSGKKRWLSWLSRVEAGS